jgi:hypothetical protein
VCGSVRCAADGSPVSARAVLSGSFTYLLRYAALPDTRRIRVRLRSIKTGRGRQDFFILVVLFRFN